ncbi:MAG: hypothetical protein ABR570_03550 [Burkholderiales bacterium]
MKSILDPSFRYVPSHATDVRKTFERIRGEAEAVHRPLDTVVPVKRSGLARSSGKDEKGLLRIQRA